MAGTNLETETKKKIGALFSEMKADADKKDAAKQAEEAKAYKEQAARLEAAKAKLNAEDGKAKEAAAEAEKLASYLM